MDPLPNHLDESAERQHEESAPDESVLDEKGRQGYLSRRNFLRASILAAAGTALVAAGCAPEPPTTYVVPPPHPLEDKYPYVPPAPTATPSPTTLRFLTADEAELVDAIASRLIPGTPADPGAHEAGVVTFVDQLLTFNQGYDEPTYIKPPIMKTYEKTPPPEASTANPKEVVYVEKGESPRYGYQSKQTPQEQYRLGLQSVNKYSQSKFGAKFTDLGDDQKDQVLKDMQEDKATGFDQPTATSFFKLILKHTGEGFFGDPAYGGNRDLAGWKLVGYPGAHRAYTEADMHNENFDVAPQTLKELPPFHPGVQQNNGAVVPVQSDQYPQQPPNENSIQQFLRYCGIGK